MKKLFVLLTLVFVGVVLAKDKPVHIKIKLDRDKEACEVGEEYYETVEGNLWAKFLVHIANKNKDKFKEGEEVEIPVLEWKEIEIPSEWLKENGKLDKKKVEEAIGMKWKKLKEKNPHLDAE